MTLMPYVAFTAFLLGIAACRGARTEPIIEPVPLAALERMTPTADVDSALAAGDARFLGLTDGGPPTVLGVHPACACGLLGADMVRNVEGLYSLHGNRVADSSVARGTYYLSYVTQYNAELLERFVRGQVDVPSMYQGRDLGECAL